MARKELVQHSLVFFVAGVIIGVVGLMILDIDKVSATRPAPAAPVNVAQRASLATSTLAPTLEPTNSPEPSATSEITETPISISEAIPTLESTPTLTTSQAFTLTSPLTTTIVPTLGTGTVVRRLVTPLRVTPTVTATLNPKRGDSPFAALDFVDDWQTLDGSKLIWYKLGERTAYPLGMQIWLDAYGRLGIGFSVFSPEQANDLNVATVPKGRGSFTKATAHDLFWEGGSANSGTWYVLVANTTALPIQYKLNSSLTVKDRKFCHSYWEYIGPNLVWWTACG